MKTRIISALVATIILLAVVFAHPVVLGTAVFIIALIGLYEFYHCVENIGYKPVKVMGFLSCLPLLYLAFGEMLIKQGFRLDSASLILYSGLLLFLLLVSLLSFIIFLNDRYNINDIALTFFGILYIPFLFAFIILMRNMNNGFYYLWLIFIGAWITDTFAYFTGRVFGKTKLLPVISPKKTVEGAFGGVAGCIAVMTLYGMYMNSFLNPIEIYHFVVIGTICGIISQIGDWAASAIKRYAKIKDYGWLMPGHGGVLDRFDSILFIAPMVYFYINLFIRF